MVTQRLGQYLKTKNITIHAFENSLGVSRASMAKPIKEGKNIGSNVVEKILSIYKDLNPTWLLTGNGEMLVTPEQNIPTLPITDFIKKSKQIPLYNLEVDKGLIPLLTNQAFDPVNKISIPNLPKCDGAVYVTGDSMYPLLKSGDIILYKQVNIPDGIIWGEMYLVSINFDDEEYVMVKYLKKSKSSDYVLLVSENKQYHEKEIRLENIKALALIKSSIRINVSL